MMEADITGVAEPALTSTLQSLHNTTAAIIPSPKDLFMLFPRIASRGAALLTEDLPAAFESLVGGPIAGRVIASATGNEGGSLGAAAAAAGATIAAGMEEAATNAGGVLGNTDGGGASFMHSFNLQQLRTFGGIFTYITSKWALGCFAAAIVLNRTSIYASARRNLQLKWYTRLAARLMPIIMLLMLSQSLTRAMRCQTSPAFSELRYGVAGKHTMLDYSSEGGYMHSITSKLLFWESDEDSCITVGMVPTESTRDEFPRGSIALLWPSFQAFCTAQWVETLLGAIQGRAPATETGMSLFEHSLAFAEAEAMVSSMIGLSTWGSGSKNHSSQKTSGDGGAKGTLEATVLVTKSFIVSRFNTPPEVLLMALISTLNNLSSQILGVFDLQARYRLINTAFWGMGFMGSFLWGFSNFTMDKGVNAGIFRFPTVCVVGFIPHTLILLGILMCAGIYGVTLLISFVSPPDEQRTDLSLKERFWEAQENMLANIPLRGLNINWQEDFYTALLRVGFTALSAASEAVFLNEGRRINLGHWTWLEEERMEEIAKLESTLSPIASTGKFQDDVANGVMLSSNETSSLLGDTQWKSGYAREKSTKVLKGGQSAAQSSGGVGANQRGGRFKLAFTLHTRIFWLIVGWSALVLRKVLVRLGIERCPSWLVPVVPASAWTKMTVSGSRPKEPKELEFWTLSDSGALKLPSDRNVDVEAEIRKRERLAYHSWGPEQEKGLDRKLYGWWRSGGWWGEKDDSGDYHQPTTGSLDDDLTSVISSTETENSMNDWRSDDDGAATSGTRTPTQADFSFALNSRQGRSQSRASTPLSSNITRRSPFTPSSGDDEDSPLDPASLARLLNPPDPDARREARMLAAHLSSPRIVTRSQYRSATISSASNVLTSTRVRPSGWASRNLDGPLTPDEEKELLEWMIVTYRARKGRGTSAGAVGSGASWSDGGAGMGEGGPQCVVCHSDARTIIVWPCRCLCLCEGCRVDLAMNNFGRCICCRQEVMGFSRLFVP